MVRKVAAEAAVMLLKDFSGQALGYFVGIRLPASFLAGSSLGAIFTLKSAVANISSRTTIERRCIEFYHISALLAFILSFNTIFTATVACTAVLHGRFDPMAETAYGLLRREFDYEFTTVRWSFLMSLFSFLGAVTARMLIEFDLLSKDCGSTHTRRDVGLAVVFSMAALIAHLLSYVNQNLWCWKSLIGMTVHFFKLLFRRSFVEQSPMEVLSLCCGSAALFIVCRIAVREFYSTNSKDEKTD